MNIRAYVAELIGVFALCFIGILAIGNFGTQDGGLTGVAFAHGLVIACLASATAAISGGHLNPAVTLGVLAIGKIKPVDAFMYWISQFIGGAAGALLAGSCKAGEASVHIRGGVPDLGTGIDLGKGILAEAVATFFLMFVIYGTAIYRRAPKLAALFIGLTVVFGILAIGPITGAALNPARYLGPALVSGFDMKNALVYFAGPCLGALVAALLWHHFLEEPADEPYPESLAA